MTYALSNRWNSIRRRCPVSGSPPRGGFTLVELLVVIAILALLAGLLLPALAGARRTSLRAACASNLRQLALANHAYAATHGAFVAAASDIWGSNRQRWHGARTQSRQPFDAALSPLAEYFDQRGVIKQCPSFAIDQAGFEAGCGGYGYNAAGVGSQAYLLGTFAGAASGMAPESIADPSRTVMFADAAFAETRRGQTRLMEYSFAEPVRLLADNRPVEAYPAIPSVHFRHEGVANVAWVDGHVSAERLAHSRNRAMAEQGIGWFGPEDNSLFDPY